MNATNNANLNDVSHEISFAISPCSTAPGNKSGIVHAHSHFIIMKAKMNTPVINAMIPGMMVNNDLLLLDEKLNFIIYSL